MEHTAKFIAAQPGFNGDARVYELDPPISGGYNEGGPYQYVIVSAADVMFSGPETYIFPAEKTGDVFDVAEWGELDGSFRGGLDHTKALSDAGYTIGV